MSIKEYAEIWIKHSKSGKDFYRRNFMYPYIEKTTKSIKNAKVLDIGCGWGDALTLIDKTNQYFGIDPEKGFFDYIKQTYPNRKIILKKGQLPNKIVAPNNHFDLVLCCLTIHYVKNLRNSIKTIFSKAKIGGKILVVGIRDIAEKHNREKFIKVYDSGEKYIKGLFRLSDETTLEAAHYFHKEKEMEKEIVKFGSFNKKYLGDVFVAYYCVKKGNF